MSSNEATYNSDRTSQYRANQQQMLLQQNNATVDVHIKYLLFGVLFPCLPLPEKRLLDSNWHPMYKGVCGELHDFVQPPYDYKTVVRDVKKWDPYVYVPPTPTDPTADPIDEELKKALAQTELDATKAG